jgi:hypothetical protein
MQMAPTRARLGNEPSRLTKDLVLLQNEKCIVRAFASDLTLPILADDVTLGYIFLGKGRFALDAIVETPKGAVGKPLVKDLDKPFIMLGKICNVANDLTPATVHDISNMGCGNSEEFLAKANEVFSRFSLGCHTRFNFEEDSQVFAFANEHDKWDMLISKGEKLVYMSRDKVYISKDKAESVDISPAGVLVAERGKTIVIGENNVLIDSEDE